MSAGRDVSGPAGARGVRGAAVTDPQTSETPRDLSVMTVAQWTDAILAALRAQDVDAVAALVRAMAVYHPAEADAVRQTLLFGAALASKANR